MVKAIATIQMGDNIYLPGEAVRGLSAKDEKWLVSNGLAEKQQEAKTKEPEQQSAKTKEAEKKA